MTAPAYATRADAKKDGWYSRRHRTGDAHHATRQERQRRQEQKRARAEAQNERTRAAQEAQR